MKLSNFDEIIIDASHMGKVILYIGGMKIFDTIFDFQFFRNLIKQSLHQRHEHGFQYLAVFHIDTKYETEEIYDDCYPYSSRTLFKETFEESKVLLSNVQKNGMLSICIEVKGKRFYYTNFQLQLLHDALLQLERNNRRIFEEYTASPNELAFLTNKIREFNEK